MTAGEWAIGVIGLLVLLGVGVGLIVLPLALLKRYLDRRDRPSAKIIVDDARQRQAVAALKAQDPSFDAASFGERACRIMCQVNEAWLKGDMGSARRLVSDGVYVRLQTQLGLARADGTRNVMADWSILSGEVVAAESDALWDTVHVRLVGEARDADVALELDAEEATRAAKDEPLRRFEEVWSFLRRRGKKSHAGVPALEGDCPSCGAPLPLGDAVRCEQCQAIVNSGEHDWVLAEITQAVEWHEEKPTQPVSGLDRLRQRDPTVSRQELEDRASVLFWKWIEAQRLGERSRLERFCLVAGQPSVEPRALRQVAVGACELHGVHRGGDGYDHVAVAVDWSAALGAEKAAGRTSRLLMGRAAGARSRRSLSSLDCPNCGGPLADSAVAKCAYCGAQLAGGRHEWMLESVASDDDA